MQISDQGLAALELEEGVVLRAYRDVAGVWTIGAGLTAASGVVKPVAGMVITREEADRLLRLALSQSYEVATQMAMTSGFPDPPQRPKQHEFDAGLSFHFNTGAIWKATWVKLWQKGASRTEIRNAMAAWSKAGGKVLPALKARRDREASMLLDAQYRVGAPAPAGTGFADWGLRLSGVETEAVLTGLRSLGYEPGPAANAVDRGTARKFQVDHGLTVDGIIGRATLTALQRALDARTRTVAPATAAVAAMSAAAAGLADQLTAVPNADASTITAALIWLASHAWGYRDIVAAALQPTLPRLAAYLRSF